MTFVEVGQQRLYVEDSGGDGPPIVFSHGFLLDHRSFARQADELSDVYRCITWDQRAAGETWFDGEPYSAWDSARDVFALLDAIGIERAVLVGAGQGAAVSLRASLLHPDRVRALVSIGGQAGPPSEGLRDAVTDAVDRWADGPSGPAATTLADLLLDDRGQEELWRERWAEFEHGAVRAAASSLLDRDDVTDRLEELAMPVLCVHGTADRAVGVDRAYAICEAASDCRGVLEVAGAGHAPTLSHPETTTPALRSFLEELPA